MSKLNILQDYKNYRKAAILLSVTALFFMAILGFESGYGMLVEWLKALPKFLSGSYSLEQWINIGYEFYGRTHHFSTIAIYGFLFYGLSWRLEYLGVEKDKITLWSALLTVLNVFAFENFYKVSLAYFQVENYQLVTIYLICLPILLFFISVFMFSILVKSKKKIQFKMNFSLFLSIIVCLSLILLWVFYPFPTETVETETWKGELFISKKLFPQTVYYSVYVPNDLLHLINVLTKMMFAVTEFFVISSFMLINREEEFQN